MKTTITQNQIFRNCLRLQRSCFSAVFFLLFLLSSSSSWGQVANLQAFTNLYNGTGNSQNLTYAVPVGTNSNRLLVVAVTTTLQTAANNRTIALTYGGRSLTLATGDLTSNTQQHTAIYFLNEAGLDLASNTTLAFTATNGTTRVNMVWAAVYDYVDQTTPLNNSRNYNSGTNNTSSFSFGTALSLASGNQGVVLICSQRTGNTSSRTITYPTNWTLDDEQTFSTTDGVRAGVADRTIPTTTTTDNCATSTSGNALASMTGIAINGCSQPTANAGSALAAICQGGTSAALGGSTSGSATGGTWSSSVAGGTFSPNATTLNATWTPPSSYSGTATLTLTSSGGSCGAATASKNLVVNPSPTAVTAVPSATAICSGGSLNLTSSATSNSATATTLLSQNFNGTPTGWTTTNTSTGGTIANAAWTLRPNGHVVCNTCGTTETLNSNDASQFYLSNSDAQGSGGTTATTLQSPSFSTLGMSAASLTFYQYYRDFDGTDSAIVEISTNGTNWTVLNTYTSTQGTRNGFVLVTTSLNSYLGQANVFIRFRYAGVWSYYWAIDNVTVTSTPVTPAISYNWTSTPAGYTSSTQNPTGVSPTVATSYTVTATNNFACTAIATSASVAVNALPAATISYSGTPFCRSLTTGQAVTQTGTAGGTYTVSPAGLTINASTGAITPSTSTAGTYTVTYTMAAAGGCSAQTATTSVTITTLPAATISYSGTPFCITNSTAQSVTLTGTSGGTYSSTTGLTINASTGAITPSTSTAGIYTVTYTMAAAGGCSAQTATTSVTITTLPAATISYAGTPFCRSLTTAQAVTRTGTTGGTYAASPAGLTIDANTGAITPSSSTAGTYTVTYTMAAAGGCSAQTATTSVTITTLPAATISYAGTPFCRSVATGQSVTLTGTSGGTYSSTAGLTIDASTGAITPSSSTAGTYTVTYTMAAAGGCAAQTATTSVTITTLPAATISYAGTPFCRSLTTAQAVTRTGTTGGTYAASPTGLTIDESTGAITPSSSTAGTYTVTYTMAAGGGCAAQTATTSVTINAAASATISYSGSAFCSSVATAQTVTLTGTTGGTYTASPVGLTINASTGAITPSTSTAGTYTVTYSVTPGGCTTFTTTTAVTINALPTAVTVSGGGTVCDQTVLTASGGTGGTIYYQGTTNNGISTTTASVSQTVTASGTYYFNAVTSEGCWGTQGSAAVTINTSPTATGTTICSGESGSLSVTSSCADLTGQTSGPNNAGTGANLTGVGTTAWSNPGNITTSGTPFATVAPAQQGTSNYLMASNYGFSIPANAIINGIQLTIARSSTQSLGTGNRDNHVRLLKNNNIEATNKAVGGVYPTGLTNQSYGNATDLWGTTWTPADINNAGFGAVLSVFNTRSLGPATATVDFMQITVTYTIPGSSNLIWYTASSGGTSIGSGTSFNPVGVANSGLVNTNTAGTTSYWVACSTATGGCRAKADFTINPSPTVTASPDQSICAGSSATITASGATSYVWSNALGTTSSVTVSPSTTTTYTVTGTDANECSNTASSTVTVNPVQAVSVSIGASATTICSGSSVTFTATPTNGGTAPTYQWKVNGSNVGSNSATFTSSTLANGNVVTCVMTSNANVCLSGSPATSNSITITVNTPIGITAITPATNPIAPTQTTTITATGVVGTGALVSWYSGPNGTGSLGATGLTSPAVGPGTYYAVVTGTCGSAIELSTTISPLASWTGNVNTLWHVTGNWAENVVPTAATNVVIGDGKVVEISTADAVANTITINGSGTLTVQSGRSVTVTNAINTTSATQFVLENNANLLQGGTTNQNAGPITVKRNSSSIIRLDYTLWSSPVASQGLYAFSKTTLPNRFYKYDTNTNFYTNSVGFNLTNLQYPSPLVAPNGINGTDENNVTFAAGKGYLIRVPWNHPTAPTSWTGNFTGVPNNGTITYTMSDFGAGQRFNLVGNPYPSPISISQFIQDNQANITSSIYFWRKTNGSSLDTYCEWNDEIFTDNEDAQSFDPGDTIRTGQGFFVEGTGDGTALVFNNGQRVNDTANQFFRTSATTTLSSQNVFWLNLTGSNAQFSQTAIAYKSYATNGIDRYDAKRIAPGTISLTSRVDGINLGIQSKSDFVNTDVVPLSYVVATAGNYSITLDNKIGIFSTGQTIYLRDRLLNVDFNLASGSYTFVSEVGTFDNRFEIVYQTNSLGVTNPIFNESQVVIYKSRSNEISINTGNFVMSSVKIFDISGRLLFEKKDIDASQALLNIRLATEVLLVQITSNEGVVVTKKVLFPRTSLKLDKKIEVKTQLAEDE